jgi:demethylmenaquinone methyltransferase/2-methoxy-6-polyprenyl-1,4-benzoquinol methylase
MFTDIAGRYDRLNRVITLGRDQSWRRLLVEQARLAPGDLVLDVGAGTGDLAIESTRQASDIRVVAVDFTAAMLAQGRARSRDLPIRWVRADAHHLPFGPKTFPRVLSGFLLRNVEDLDQALAEQLRVLGPGGQALTLDTTWPTHGPIAWLVRTYFRLVVPILGWAFSGHVSAYRYLASSTAAHLTPGELAARLASVGFDQCGYRRLMLGSVVIHWGTRLTRSDRARPAST